MSSTLASRRPRPVDVNKQLLIVRDISELDNTDFASNLEDNIKAEQPKLAQTDQQVISLPLFFH
jgi:hypothetical protein